MHKVVSAGIARAVCGNIRLFSGKIRRYTGKMGFLNGNIWREYLAGIFEWM